MSKLNFKNMNPIRSFSLLALTSLIVLSCGKPNDPESIYTSAGYTIVKKFVTPADAMDLCVNDSLCYIAQGEGGLLIVNIKDVNNPEIVSITTDGISGYSRSILRKDNHVYLLTGSFGGSGIDVSNPSIPVVTIDNMAIKPSNRATIKDNYMFTAISDNGVKISELTTPSLPEPRATTNTNGYANDVAVEGNMTLMFVACGELGLSIFNISNFEEGYGTYPIISWLDTPGYAESVVLNEVDSIAYVASGEAGLQIIDYKNIQNPQIVGSFSTGGNAIDIMYSNQRIFISLERGGFQVIDVSNYTKPKEIARLNLQRAKGFDMDDSYIYVADDIEGLVIIKKP